MNAFVWENEARGRRTFSILHFLCVFVCMLSFCWFGGNFHLAFSEEIERYRFGGREMVYFHENCDKSFCTATSLFYFATFFLSPQCIRCCFSVFVSSHFSFFSVLRHKYIHRIKRTRTLSVPSRTFLWP